MSPVRCDELLWIAQDSGDITLDEMTYVDFMNPLGGDWDAISAWGAISMWYRSARCEGSANSALNFWQ
ncbi:hypothetical protein A0H81_03014 [Grifola frondosa]|uniref:Uncharacterized protein n=1 Tax=Grifola frondosa TaxID=5627 RepID=A0A1C7MJ52_GRIFR|nr:hypothetical protein A0H81_03014 [Grifola frondosa]